MQADVSKVADILVFMCGGRSGAHTTSDPPSMKHDVSMMKNKEVAVL